MYQKSLLIISLLLISCSEVLPPNPQQGFKRLLVRTLCDNKILDEKGFYTFYWNGKDDSGRYVSPGQYRCEFQFQNLYKEFFFDILAGGESGKNNEEKYEYNPTSWNEFFGISPSPFKVKSGTNVEFSTQSEGVVTIKFYFDKNS